MRIAEQVSCIVFFKQKAAYEVIRSLVGSERWIRDSACMHAGGAQEVMLMTGCP